MKANRLLYLVLVSMLLFTSLASAMPRPRPLPVGGYWNLETNLATRDYTIVRFYDAQDQLMYEERLDNLCLDLSGGTSLCRRTARRLDVALQQVLRNPSSAGETTTMLALQLGQNRRVQRSYAVR
ncbi:hypothetical protein [Hymenobacter algoricola]|uniref:Lipocalin-like domain-containing protein n=1 Tax=Hymenobacter algoricola TaxID=486267 RepID=A0ABP7MTR9_9BACT